MIVLNSIFPVFMIICMGRILKKFHLTTDEYLRISDRLIYYAFFPAMMFWKIGAPSTSVSFNWPLILASLATVLTIYILSLTYIRVAKVAAFETGTFSQCSYRFNTYVGMAVILTALGDHSVREFSIMIGLTIPFINILAVSTLIWFSGGTKRGADRIRLIIKEALSNPLVIGCFAGIIYSRIKMPFPLFMENSFKMISLMTLPLALISVGGALKPSRFKRYFKNAFVSSFFKLALLPLVGYVFLKIAGVGDDSLKVGMIFFALPTSTATYILSSQLNSDTELASTSIFLSTLFSALSLSIVIYLFVS